MLQTIQMKLWWFIIYLHILVYIWQVHVFVWCAGVHVVAMVPVLRSGNNSLSQFSPSIYIWIPAIKFKCQPCTTSALPTGWSCQPQIMLWKLGFMSVKKHIICHVMKNCKLQNTNGVDKSSVLTQRSHGLEKQIPLLYFIECQWVKGYSIKQKVMMSSGGAAIIDKPWPCKPRYSEYLWGLCFFCEVLLSFHTAARVQAIVLLLSTEADNRHIIWPLIA